MVTIELIPDTSHCIETVAKREYNKALSELLTFEKQNEHLQRRIEILKTFLETMDFSKLRQESETHIIEGRKVKFVVYLQGTAVHYEMELE